MPPLELRNESSDSEGAAPKDLGLAHQDQKDEADDQKEPQGDQTEPAVGPVLMNLGLLKFAAGASTMQQPPDLGSGFRRCIEALKGFQTPPPPAPDA